MGVLNNNKTFSRNLKYLKKIKTSYEEIDKNILLLILKYKISLPNIYIMVDCNEHILKL